MLQKYLSTATSALAPARKAPTPCPQRLAQPATQSSNSKLTAASADEPAKGLVQHRNSATGQTVMISAMDAFFIQNFGRDSPVIPVGCFLTAVILGSGLVQFNSGNKGNQQMFMRARVVAQGLTVTAMMISLGVQQREKELGLYKDLY
eukprot:CAMPEP_0206232936 /NCGR_PEP_ID=MMETSP0047_2-20121206/11698_1 /ASSEMBLY_ACC=CAM_ASM_000192 /TAXON_ID=195065 /ORGANISM="Chroomonas mesostigmatica_cf, Strain CCMP1168" /LENGTH=147 /DNA_ID=CAMNT_0053656739 /DNA_START=71 /DNA_END=514 /DNA_ORIENTATION=+